LIACAIGSTAGAQQSWGPNWTHTAQGNENWSPRNVTLANRASQVLTQFGPASDFTRLFSATDVNPPSPVWQNDTGAMSFGHRVASAEQVDVFATLHDQNSSTQGLRNLVLRKFTSSSSAPDWSFPLPFTTNTHEDFFVAITPDGQNIVAAAVNIWNSANTEVYVFGPDSGTPVRTWSIDTFGLTKRMQVSDDGSTLLLGLNSGIHVVDLASGATAFSRLLSGQVFDAMGMSGSGQWIAYGGLGYVKLLERTQDGYADRVSHAASGTVYCNRLAISSNGSALALTFDDYATPLAVRVQVMDIEASVAAGAAVFTLDATVQGSGAYSNLTSAVEISAKGSRIAVGLWGDEAGQAPEVLVYQNGDNTPIRTFDLPGSVKALDLSADGRHLAVASKGVHNNVFGGGGRIDSFDITDGDFKLVGVPKSNATLHFEHKGTPFMPALMLVSGLESSSLPFFPGIGTLYVDRTSLTTLPMPAAGANGIASRDFVVPNAMVGQTLYFQGMNLAPRVLSDDWYKVTVLP
jgi:hypothetical protein